LIFNLDPDEDGPTDIGMYVDVDGNSQHVWTRESVWISKVAATPENFFAVCFPFSFAFFVD